MSPRYRRVLAPAVLLVAAAMGIALFVALRTGSVSYVTTHGVSMQPRFHRGDLAILRQEPGYHPGEVIAYRSHLLHTVVMHRIVGERDGAFVMKGDNNPWLDADKPTRADVVGSLWLHVPHGGFVLGTLRNRSTLVAVAAAVSLLGGAAATKSRRRRPKRRQRRASRRFRPHWALAPQVLPYLSVVVLGFAVLATWGFSRPDTRSAPHTIKYAQSGGLNYGAPAPSDVVYEQGQVRTGDPVFLHVLSAVQLKYEYRFVAAHPHRLNGVIVLRAEVVDSNGWHRRIDLSPETRFAGDHADVHAPLDVAHIQTLVNEAQQITGARTGTSTVAIVADTRVGGELAGRPLQTQLLSRVSFALDPVQLRPATSSTAGAPGPNPFATNQSGSVQVYRRTARQVRLLGYRIRVSLVRWLGLLGSVGGGALLIVALVATRPHRHSALHG